MSGSAASVAREVTVVIPVWDAYVEYLDDALSSVASQAPAPVILLVDNVSRVPLGDRGGAQIIRAPKRISLGQARSLGLAHVETEFVLFWDADDTMPPNTLSLLLARIRADHRLKLVATRIVEDDGRPHPWPRRFTHHLASVPKLFAVLHSINSFVPTIGALMRTAAVRDAGGFPDVQTGDDWVLGVALSFRGRLDVLPQTGRVYRQHGNSVWATRQTRQHLLEHAREVRRWIAADPEAPRYMRRSLPLIATAQWCVISLLRPARQLRDHWH